MDESESLVMIQLLMATVRTCDNEALIVLQSFRKETRDDELRVDEEPDFFLDQSLSGYSSTYKPICKVHLGK